MPGWRNVSSCPGPYTLSTALFSRGLTRLPIIHLGRWALSICTVYVDTRYLKSRLAMLRMEKKGLVASFIGEEGRVG